MDETPTSRSRWFGFERVRVDYKNHAVNITVDSESAWDRSHLRRLRQSSDLPGHVPVIDADVSSEGRPYVVTAAVEEPTLADQLASEGGVSWNDSTGITEAVARACHEAHERGLFHGALSPHDVYIIDDEIAVDGLGLTRGGEIPKNRNQWVAPEVLAGDAPTARSDVYSLGKLLEASLADSIELVPRSVKRLIMWSSSDTPEARPRSASEFAEILSDGLGDNKSSFRPAFIPTIRANNLTADAEKAVADTQTDVALTSVTTGEIDLDPETLTTDEAGDPAEDIEIEIDEDTTEQLEIIDLDDIETDDEEEVVELVREDELIDETEDILPSDDDEPTADADDASSSVPKAAATIGVVGAAALVANKLGSNKKEDKSEDKETAESTSETKNASGKKAAQASSKTKGAAAVARAAATKKPGGIDKSKSSFSYKEATEDDDRGLSRFLVPALIIVSMPLLLWALLRSGGGNDQTASSATDTTIEAGETESLSTDGIEPEDVENANPQATEAPESTEEPETVAAPEVTEASKVPDTADVPETTDESKASNVTPAADKSIKSSDAAIQVIHGIPATPVDVYIDGVLTAASFEPESIAGPVALTAGSHDVAIFVAEDNPAESADERADDAVIDESITASGSPTALIAHLDDTGTPILNAFAESLEELEAGETRIAVRNLTVDAGKATVSIDGKEQTAPLANGQELEVVLPAGEHTIALLDENGDEVYSSDLDLVEGELTTIGFIGSTENASQSVVIQRYSGLSSAPTAVPTGDSGLLDAGPSSGGARTILGLTMMMLLTGAMIAFKRRRSMT